MHGFVPQNSLRGEDPALMAAWGKRLFAPLRRIFAGVVHAIQLSRRQKAERLLEKYAHFVRERRPDPLPYEAATAAIAPVLIEEPQPEIILWRRRPSEDEGRRRRRR